MFRLTGNEAQRSFFENFWPAHHDKKQRGTLKSYPLAASSQSGKLFGVGAPLAPGAAADGRQNSRRSYMPVDAR